MADENDARTLAQQLLQRIGGAPAAAPSAAPAAAPEAAAPSAAAGEAAALLQRIAPQGENVVMTVEGGGRIVEMQPTGQEGIDVQTGRPIPQYSFVSPGYSTNDQAIVRRIMEGMPVRDATAEARAAAAEGPTPLREQYSSEMFETAGRAAGGLVGGEGVVDLSGSMPLYREGGAEVSLPAPARAVGEYLGDVLMTAAGAGGGSFGYIAGGLGDLLVSSGVMDRNQANRLVRDVMAMPEAFAGSPGQVMTAPRMAAPRAVRMAEEAAPAARRAEGAVPPPRVPEVPEAAPAAVPSRAVGPGGAIEITQDDVLRYTTPEERQAFRQQQLEWITRDRIRREEPAPAAAAAPEMAPPRVEAPEAAPAAPGAAPQAAAAVVDQDTRIGELIRRGAGFGIGARRAREELARLAQANPEAAAAAERLGIDLPVDVLTDQRQIREAIGATRSISGSEATTAWKDDLIRITEQADNAIQELGGATDLSTVSDRVLSRLSGTQTELRQRAGDIYNQVDAAVPRGTRFEPNNIVRALNQSIEELGGETGMTAAERRLFQMVSDPEQPVTYGRLMREKDQIRRALDGDIRENPYGSVDQTTLRRMYNALTDDQLANVERVGGTELRDNLVLANQLWRQQGELGTQIVSAFGRDQQGSIASRLRSAIASGSRGDVSGLNRTLQMVPEDLRREAVVSAIREIASGTQGGVRGFGFSQYTNLYSSLRRNPEVYRQVVDAIGPDANAVLRDLYEISRRVTDARANIITTGRANQPLISAMRAEGLMGRFMNTTAGRRAVQATTTGTGGAVGGLPGAMIGDAFGDMLARAQPDRMQAASRLFRSDDFKALVEQAASQPEVAPRVINRVANSRDFRRWAEVVGIEDPRNWLQGAILAASADQGAEPEAQQ